MAGLTRTRLAALAVVATLIAMATSGCWDRRELEDQAFILSLGVDRGQGEVREISARVAIPRNLGGGAGGGGGSSGGGRGGGEKPSELVTVRAPTIEGALNMLGPLMGRRISLTHLTELVVGEDLAREGVRPVLRGLLRFREARRTIQFSVAKGTAREIMEKNRPPLEKNMAKFNFDVAETRRFNALVPASTLHIFETDLQDLDQDPVAMLVAVNRKAADGGPEVGGKGSPSGEDPGGDQSSFTAGEIPRKGGNPVEFLGTAVFQKDRMVGTLTAEETRTLLILRGDFARSLFSVPDPEVKGQFVAVELRRGRRPQYRTSIQNEKISIRESIFLEGDLLAVPSGIDYTAPGKKRELERQIETVLSERAQTLVEKAQKEFRADPFSFGFATRSKLRTWVKFEDFAWLSKFPDADISVDFKVKLRRIGLQLAPATPAPR